jgi:hypothetical protein
LIGFGYDLEQELNVQSQPQFLGSALPITNVDLASGRKFFAVFLHYLTAVLFLRKLAVLLGRP